MPQNILRIATRQSPLALWQARYIGAELTRHYPNIRIELLPLVTSGDKFLIDKLQAAGGKGLFVKELEESLLTNRADIAVHSTKDMPADLPQGLHLAVICKRDNPFDVLISTQGHNLQTLPPESIIGTASLRRQSQLLAYRHDLQVNTLRGNINTRLAKLAAGEYHAIVLAAAGLERMHLQKHITEQLSEEIMLPACGQGALCIECRTDDDNTRSIIAALNDPITSLCVTTERRVNAQLGGNCHVPLAVFCTPIGANQLLLRAKIVSPDGKQCLFDQQQDTVDKAEIMAQQCTASLLNQGASHLIKSIPL